MLKRKITKFLINWKNRKHNPLIIYGARQVGKTTSIREFGLNNYESFVEINFIFNPEYKEVFTNFNVDDIISKISFRNPNFKFIPNHTLIFFDEIQSYMDATTSLKTFSLDGRFDVICSSSALGVNNLHISSVAVGYKEEYIMRGLDFEEYLWAKGYDDKIINTLYNSLINLTPLDNFVLKIINDLFREYSVIGGMPKIVSSFINTKNYHEPYLLQKELRKDYLDDIKQYVTGLDKSKVTKIYENISLQLAKDNHKFQFSKMGHGARFSSYFDCFNWLMNAGIILMTYNVKEIKQPLKLYLEDNNFRVYFADLALFMAFLDPEAEEKMRTHYDFSIYNGGLYENLVLDNLVKSGFENIFFYRSQDSTIEIDFIINYLNKIIPIEVKSKKGRAISLNKILEKYDNIDFAIKFGDYNVGVNNKTITLPYSLSFLLKRFLTEYLQK